MILYALASFSPETSSIIDPSTNSFPKHTKPFIRLRPILNKPEGLSIKIKLLCYKQSIRLIIAYGFPAWSSILSAQMERIRVLERKCLRACINYRSALGSFIYITNTKLYSKANVNRIDRVLVQRLINFFAAQYSTSDKFR